MDKNELYNLSSIEFALRYPFKTEDDGLPYENIWFGSLFFLFGIFTIIPLVMILGYITRIRQASAIQRHPAPKFTNFGQMFYEGINTIKAYTPIISFSLFALLAYMLGYDFMLGLIPILMYIFPAVGVMYSMKRKYEIVYSHNLIELITSKEYFIAYIKSMLILLFFIPLFIIGSLLSVGLALLVYLPVLLYSRPAYWGKVYSEIRSKNDNLP